MTNLETTSESLIYSYINVIATDTGIRILAGG